MKRRKKNEEIFSFNKNLHDNYIEIDVIELISNPKRIYYLN